VGPNRRDDIIATGTMATTRQPTITRGDTPLPELSSSYAKTGSREAPRFLFLLVSSRKRCKILVVFLGDAHRKSGVISLCFALSPVESCSPPELLELTPQMYASDTRNASQQI
jgi:hypothetical protein